MNILLYFIYRFTFDVPEDTEEIFLTAYYQDSKNPIRAQAETTAYSSYGPEDRHIYIRTNNRYIQVKKKQKIFFKAFARQYS